MANLNSDQKAIFDDLRKRSGEALRSKNYDQSIELSLKAWEILPEPKGSYDESYHVVTGIIFIYRHMNDFQNDANMVSRL